jgi:hypothetical protein
MTLTEDQPRPSRSETCSTAYRAIVAAGAVQKSNNEGNHPG